jgi:hypothetical protein
LTKFISRPQPAPLKMDHFSKQSKLEGYDNYYTWNPHMSPGGGGK